MILGSWEWIERAVTSSIVFTTHLCWILFYRKYINMMDNYALLHVEGRAWFNNEGLHAAVTFSTLMHKRKKAWVELLLSAHHRSMLLKHPHAITRGCSRVHVLVSLVPYNIAMLFKNIT